MEQGCMITETYICDQKLRETEFIRNQQCAG